MIEIPCDIDTERGVVGALLLAGTAGASPHGHEILDVEDFHDEKLRIIFRAILELEEAGEPFDPLAVAAWLKKHDKLSDAGGRAHLAALEDNASTWVNLRHWAGVLVEVGKHRRAAFMMAKAVAGFGTDPDEATDRLVEGLAGITAADRDQTSEGFSAEGYQAELQTRAERPAGISTGFPTFDGKIQGMGVGMHIIAARPSCGKSALAIAIARHVGITERRPVLIVSMEMPRVQIDDRIVSAESGIPASEFKRGRLMNLDHHARCQATMERIDGAPIAIVDKGSPTIRELAGIAKQWASRHPGYALIIIDYLQLATGRGDNREQEVASISRCCKAIAVDLNVPVIALSQLNRAVKEGDVPGLHNLRESGCLTGDTLIPMADTGARVPIGELVGSGSFNTLAMNQRSLRIEPAEASRAFCTGRRPVFTLKTQLGRTVRATGNHRFLTINGWRRLDELSTGEHLATPRVMPGGSKSNMSISELALLGHLIGDGCTLPRHAIQYTTKEAELADEVMRLGVDLFGDDVRPRAVRERSWIQVYLASTRKHTHDVRSAVSDWLRGLGVWGLRSYEKSVPVRVFQQSSDGTAVFLKHLWATDGCVGMRRGKSPYPSVYYATSSMRLAMDVASLLLRQGIVARVTTATREMKGREHYHVTISGADDLRKFIDKVGAFGERRNRAMCEIGAFLSGIVGNTNRDVIPKDAWVKHVKPAMKRSGVSHRELHKRLGMEYSGMTIFRQNMGRGRAARVAEAVESEELGALSRSDVYWDKVVSVVGGGVEDVFDITVPGPHNFVANDIIAHNSLEQDADTVTFIHFDGSPSELDVAELIISKNRNGACGKTRIGWDAPCVRFYELD